MKNRIGLIMSMLIVLSMTISTIVVASDANQSSDHNTSNHGLIIYSQEISTGAWEYAVENFDRFLQASIISEAFSVGRNTSLGTPVAILGGCAHAYYFPVISDGIIVGTFRIFVDDRQSEGRSYSVYTGIMSPYLASDLNDLLVLRRASSSAILLYYDNGNLMVQIDDVVEVLAYDPLGYQPTWDEPAIGRAELIAVPIMETTINSERHDYQNIMPLSPYRFLSVRIIETQGRESWCAAFATSMIIRYINITPNQPNALALMRAAYPGISDDVLRANHNFTNAHMRTAFTSRGFNFVETSRALTLAEAQAQIRRGNPVYMGTRNAVADGRHAFVLRGYVNISPFPLYSIWNPWESFFETTCSSTTMIRARDRNFIWDRSFSGWR